MNAVEVLQSHHLKKTSPRVAVIEALLGSSGPLSEDEVKQKMGQLYDRITFYRSMHTLAEAGIIHKIAVEGIPVKYALNRCTDQHEHTVDHVHFVCRQCSSLLCLNEVKSFQYVLPQGYVLESSEVVIRGLCKRCSTE